MNPKVGQLMSMIMPSAPSEVFEADLPDVETIAQNKLTELANLFGKYGSTKAEPFVEQTNSVVNETDPSVFAVQKSKALASMLQQYGEAKAAPYLASIQSLQTSLPENTLLSSVTPSLNLENIPKNVGALSNLTGKSEDTTPLKKMDESTLTNFELALTDELGQALPGQHFELTLANGKVAKGISDEMGMVKVAGVEKGLCQLALPGLDAETWSLL